MSSIAAPYSFAEASMLFGVSPYNLSAAKSSAPFLEHERSEKVTSTGSSLLSSETNRPRAPESTKSSILNLW